MSVDFSDERISAYLDGELTAAERAEIEALLASSVEHRQLVEELRALRTTLQELPRPAIASDFAERVMLRAMQATSEGSPSGSDGANGHLNAKAAPGGATSVSELALRHSLELRWWRRAFWSISTVAAGLLGLLVISNTDHFAVVALGGRGPMAAAPKNAVTDSNRSLPSDATDFSLLEERSAHGEPQLRGLSLGASDHSGLPDRDAPAGMDLNQDESAKSAATHEGLGATAATRARGGETGKSKSEKPPSSSSGDLDASDGTAATPLRRGTREIPAPAGGRAMTERAGKGLPAVELRDAPRAAENTPAPLDRIAGGGAAAPRYATVRDRNAGGAGGGAGGGLGGMGPDGQRGSSPAPPGPPGLLASPAPPGPPGRPAPPGPPGRQPGAMPGLPQPGIAAPKVQGAAGGVAGQPDAAGNAKGRLFQNAASDKKNVVKPKVANDENGVPAEGSNTATFRMNPTYVLRVTLPPTNTISNAEQESIEKQTNTRQPSDGRAKDSDRSGEQALAEQLLNKGTLVQVSLNDCQEFIDGLTRANGNGTTTLYLITDTPPVNFEREIEAKPENLKRKPAGQVAGVPPAPQLNLTQTNQARYALVVPDNRLSQQQQNAATANVRNALPIISPIDDKEQKQLRALAESKAARLRLREAENGNNGPREEMIDIILVVDTPLTSRDVPAAMPPTSGAPTAKPVTPPAEPK